MMGQQPIKAKASARLTVFPPPLSKALFGSLVHQTKTAFKADQVRLWAKLYPNPRDFSSH
jgi:hypothetical protein